MVATLALGAMVGVSGTLGYQHATSPDRALRRHPAPGSLDAALYEAHDGIPWYVEQRVCDDGRALVIVENGGRAREWTVPAELPDILAARDGMGGQVVDGTVTVINTGRAAATYGTSRLVRAYQAIKTFFSREQATPAAPAK